MLPRLSGLLNQSLLGTALEAEVGGSVHVHGGGGRLGVRHGDQLVLELADVGDGLEDQVEVTGGRGEVGEALPEAGDLLPLLPAWHHLGQGRVVLPHQPPGAQLARGLGHTANGKILKPPDIFNYI